MSLVSVTEDTIGQEKILVMLLPGVSGLHGEIKATVGWLSVSLPNVTFCHFLHTME